MGRLDRLLQINLQKSPALIRLLQHNEIDFEMWDECVANSVFPMPYALSWYLDVVAEKQWVGLVEDDYRSVFPVAWRKKLGIKYAYQPFFCQQLGLFSKKKLTVERLDAFLMEVKKHFKFIEINLNQSNCFENSKSTFPNFELVLSVGYLELKNGYSTNLKRNLKKAENNKLKIIEELTVQQLISLFRKSKGAELSELKQKHYSILATLIETAIIKNNGFLIGVETKANELVSAGFFLKWKNRLINLFPATSSLGKNLGASPFLLDHIIEKNSGQNKLLDFEGSRIDSVARFYKSYGSTERRYPLFRINNLLVTVKWMKR